MRNKFDGDNSLSRIAKRLRAKKRETAPNTPLFKQVIREVWDKSYELGKKGNQVPIKLLHKLTPRRSEHIEAALWALEKANKIKIDREKGFILIVFS